jgi:MSHA type pilus biogenesis protein MshL
LALAVLMLFSPLPAANLSAKDEAWRAPAPSPTPQPAQESAPAGAADPAPTPAPAAEAPPVPVVATPPAAEAAPAPTAEAAPVPTTETTPTPVAPTPVAPAAPVVASPATNAPDSLGLHTQGKQVYGFRAENLDLKTALATFARQNNLNIVPDNDVMGQITMDVRNLPLEQMMRALLEASDCVWAEESGLIRVRNTETRIFVVDYLRLSRKSTGQSSATLNSATSGGSGGGSGGSSGGSGGGGGGGGDSGGGSGGGGGGASSGGSSVNLGAENTIDFWSDIDKEVKEILSACKGNVTINKTACILEVTARPSAVRRVEKYLSTIGVNVNRQVEIEAKIFDVQLGNQLQFGINWERVSQTAAGAATYGFSTVPQAIGGFNKGLSSFNFIWTNMNTSVMVEALETEGKVEVIAKPRIRVLNNQTAMIKVGTETPFFSITETISQSQSGNLTTSGDVITTVTVGTILSITPQISSDGWISLDISPVLTSLQKTEYSPSGTASAPVLDTKQASTLVRVRDGYTIVLGGLIHDSRAKNDRKIPLLGDIPVLGKLFTGTFRASSKKELVIFVTPHLVQ